MKAIGFQAVYIYWIDESRRLEICDKLGLSRQTTVNGKTVILMKDMTMPLYDALTGLQTKDILRITLKP